MSLKAELGRRLMQDMILKSKGKSKAIVLVVDYHTSKILSSCLRMFDVMEAGVIVLENVLLDREKLDLPAIYFVEPTAEVIARIVQDFDPALPPNSKAPARSQYNAAHVFFTTRISAEQMKQLSSSKRTVSKLKDLVELNVDFLSLESNVFSFDRRTSIPKLFFPSDTSQMSEELANISRHLVSLCLTTHEFPYVRYAGTSSLAKGLAQFFHNEMNTTIAKLKDWQYSDSRERGTLLIVDRSLDPVAPLMHEYTFQVMVNDLLKVKGELCYLPHDASSAALKPTAATNTGMAEDDARANALVLSEDDPLWVDLRHRHIAEAMQTVTERFKAFKSNNKLAKLQSDDAASVKDMIQAMKDMPEYKSMMKRYHKHMSLAQECMDRFNKKKLKDLGELEQDIATGLTNDGKAVNQKILVKQLQDLCVSPLIGALERLRLVMIYLASQGGMDESIKRDLLAGISPVIVRAIDGLNKLGVDVHTMASKGKINKDRAAEFAQRNKTISLALMRFIPALYHLIEQSVTYSLDEDSFPYVTPPPEDQREKMQTRQGKSARRRVGGAATTSAATVKDVGSSDWKRDDGADSGADRRPRFLVFVIGGLTFSEMRSAYEIGEQHKASIYIGSTHTLTPASFLQQLSGLHRPVFKEALEQSLRPGESLPEEFSGDQDEQPARMPVAAVSPQQVQLVIQK